MGKRSLKSLLKRGAESAPPSIGVGTDDDGGTDPPQPPQTPAK